MIEVIRKRSVREEKDDVGVVGFLIIWARSGGVRSVH
jgi:hypothetical protein